MIKKINDKRLFELLKKNGIDGLRNYLIYRTRCIQNNGGQGTSIDIDLKLLGLIYSTTDPGNYIRSNDTGNSPLMEKHGINTYFSADGFSFARKNNFSIFKKNIINRATNVYQCHIVITDDSAIIAILRDWKYEEESGVVN